MSYLDALQETLAAEHAAVYVIAALGAQTSESQSPALYGALTDSYTDHRSARDRLVDLVRQAGGDPVVARTAYTLPPDLNRSEVVEQNARDLEGSVAATYAALVASSTGSDRRWPTLRLQATAVRELDFGGSPEMFPGSEEYASP